MRIVGPKSNDDRLDFLRKAATVASEDQAAESSILTDELVARSLSLYQKYDSKYVKLGLARTEKSAQIKNKNDAEKKLRQIISHFNACVSMRNQRLEVPESFLKIYQMPSDESISACRTLTKLIRLANNCIRGDELSVLKGQEPMVNPSPADVQKLIEYGELVEKEENAADRNLVGIQNELDKLLVPLNELRTDMQTQFNKANRDMEPSRQRRIMRRYGFGFVSADTSQEEEEPEASPGSDETGNVDPPSEESVAEPEGNETVTEPENPTSETPETPEPVPAPTPQTEN